MYYTNVDLYANLKQLRGLCRQEFYQCSPVLFPAAARGRGSGRLVGLSLASPRRAACGSLGLACRPQDSAGRVLMGSDTESLRLWRGRGPKNSCFLPDHPFPKVQPCPKVKTEPRIPENLRPADAFVPPNHHLGGELEAEGEEIAIPKSHGCCSQAWTHYKPP